MTDASLANLLISRPQPQPQTLQPRGSMGTGKNQILCVSPDLDQCELLARWFELQNYALEKAATVAEGCRLLREGNYSLVFFDDWLNGQAEISAGIRAVDPSIPLVILSTNPFP